MTIHNRLNHNLLSSFLLSLLVLLLAAGCKKKKETPMDKIIVEINGKALSQEEVIRKIPIGLSQNDSLKLYKEIVYNWIKTQLLIDLAETELSDLDEIDNKVEQYRNRLIVMEYMSRLRDTQTFDISRDSVEDYYKKFHQDLLTENVLVKGIVIKADEDSPHLETLRNLINNPVEENIDKIENLRLEEDFFYQYFGNQWLDWGNISEDIPYRVSNPDIYFKENKYLETSRNGDTYMVYITDFLPSGSEMPYEYAVNRITEILKFQDIDRFESNIINRLIERAEKEGKIRFSTEPAD